VKEPSRDHATQLDGALDAPPASTGVSGVAEAAVGPGEPDDLFAGARQPLSIGGRGYFHDVGRFAMIELENLAEYIRELGTSSSGVFTLFDVRVFRPWVPLKCDRNEPMREPEGGLRAPVGTSPYVRRDSLCRGAGFRRTEVHHRREQDAS
jgi:hypothetical protein